MDVTAQESSCEYDGTIDVATAPSRKGYNFTGWTVRPQMDFNALRQTLTLTSTQERWSVGESGGARYCWHAVHTNDSVHEACSYRSEYTDLEANEWKTETTQGMIYGSAHCSAKSGDRHDWTWATQYRDDWAATIAELDAATGDKKYCWCQVTGFTPANSSTMYGPDVPLSWVFDNDYGSPSSCSFDCASLCSGRVRDLSGFRAALFGN